MNRVGQRAVRLESAEQRTETSALLVEEVPVKKITTFLAAKPRFEAKPHDSVRTENPLRK